MWSDTICQNACANTHLVLVCSHNETLQSQVQQRYEHGHRHSGRILPSLNSRGGRAGSHVRWLSVSWQQPLSTLGHIWLTFLCSLWLGISTMPHFIRLLFLCTFYTHCTEYCFFQLSTPRFSSLLCLTCHGAHYPSCTFRPFYTLMRRNSESSSLVRVYIQSFIFCDSVTLF